MADYIDRQAAMDVFESLADEDWNKNTGTTWANAFIEVAGMIDGIPPADVAPVKHGHWTERVGEVPDDPYYIFRKRFYCSVCGDWQTYGKTDYCPMCGSYNGGHTE